MSILSVKGPQDGEITLHTSPDTVMGTFNVGFNAASPSGSLFVLYRLRVKEASILFSKTYSILGGDHIEDHITMFAQPSLLSSEKISTIRVEYTVLSAEDTAQLTQPNVQLDRTTCQPFFARRGSLTYDVKCVVSTAPAPSTPPAGTSTRGTGVGAHAGPSQPSSMAFTRRAAAGVIVVASLVAICTRLYRPQQRANA